MNLKRFNELIAMAGDKMYTLVKHKGVGKYSTEDDALHNFRVIAKKRERTMGQALQGMADKHETVVEDMVSGVMPITEELILEHAIDRLTYAALMVPVLYEMMGEQNAEPEVVETADGVFKKSEECDTCSEQDTGFAEAIIVVEDQIKHCERVAVNPAFLSGMRDALEALRKERKC